MMQIIIHIRKVFIILGIFFLPSCTVFFENDSDFQARQALLQLMKAQEQYRQDHNRYSNKIFDIEQAKKYSLEYHKGIVYMDIEKADEDGYRAIALPAESSTARVFAFDSDKGGFYEMEEEEVSQYVLGALRFIQKQRTEKLVKDLSSIILVSVLLLYGAVPLFRQGVQGYGMVYAAHFLSLLPLFLGLTALNHMDKTIVFSLTLSLSLAFCLAVALTCLIVSFSGIQKYYKNLGPTPIVGILFSLVLTCSFSLFVLTHTYIKFS